MMQLRSSRALSRRRFLAAALGLALADALRAAPPVCPASSPSLRFPNCGEAAPARRAGIEAGIRELPGLARVMLPPLPTPGSSFTVSGISSGAAMAMQMHVAHSARIDGAGLFAGPPYGCAVTGDGGNDILDRVCRALSVCMQGAPDAPDPAALAALIDQLARAGKVDPVSALRQARVWILEGKADTTLNARSARVAAELYRRYAGDAAVRYEERAGLEHAWPTADAAVGSSCAAKGPPYVNACGYSGTDRMLEFLLRRAPRDRDGARLAKFSQRRFLRGFGGHLADEGLVALPPTIDRDTRLHVAFHGCEQGTECLGTAFARETGLVAAAARFNLVVLLPQVRATPVTNPKGCWDWWGYNEPVRGSLFGGGGRGDDFEFMTHCGDQMEPLMTMALAVAGGPASTRC